MMHGDRHHVKNPLTDGNSLELKQTATLDTKSSLWLNTNKCRGQCTSRQFKWPLPSRLSVARVVDSRVFPHLTHPPNRRYVLLETRCVVSLCDNRMPCSSGRNRLTIAECSRHDHRVDA